MAVCTTRECRGPIGLGRDELYYDLTRGFVGTVLCPPSAWTKFGREIVRKHPITKVQLFGAFDNCFGGDPLAWAKS